MRSRAVLTALAVAILGGTATGCTRIEQALERISFFAYMRDSPAFDPYEAPRPAPAGAVPSESPRGDAALAAGNSQTALTELAGRVTNPAPMDSASLVVGQAMYDRHCAVCHNVNGQGAGPVIGAPPRKFPMGPTLVSGAVQGYSDGYIYAVIRQGRGLMPAYGYRMDELERWQVVNYIRHLQGTAGQAGNAAAAQAPADGAATGAAPAAANDTTAQ